MVTTLATSTILLIIFLIIIFIGGIGGVVYWIVEEQQKRHSLNRCVETTPSIVASLVPDTDISLAHKAWLQVLLQRHYMDKVNTPGAVLVLGGDEMGRETILRFVAQQINSRFPRTRTFSIYFDIAPISRVSQLMGKTILEEMYKRIVWNLVAPFSNSIYEILGEKDYRRSGLANLTNKLHLMLVKNSTEISYAEIRITVMEIWRILGIERTRICLDGITELGNTFTPYLLTMVMKTFGQSGKVDMIIGGDSRQITLQSRTPNSLIGMQLGHDILLAIDMDALLIPELSNIDTSDDIRLDFLASVLANSDSAIAQTISREKIIQLFSPPNSWKYVFEKTNGNLDIIARAMIKIAEYTQINGGKVVCKHVDAFLSA